MREVEEHAPGIPKVVPYQPVLFLSVLWTGAAPKGMVPVSVPVSFAEPEPVGAGIFSRSRSRCEGPAPGSSSTLDKTEEMLNDILFVCFNID